MGMDEDELVKRNPRSYYYYTTPYTLLRIQTT